MSVSFFLGEHNVNNSPSNELPQREVFILRLWHPKNYPNNWQAQVQHVGSGKVTQVHNSQELLDCILQQIELPFPSKPGKVGLK